MKQREQILKWNAWLNPFKSILLKMLQSKNSNLYLVKLSKAKKCSVKLILSKCLNSVTPIFHLNWVWWLLMQFIFCYKSHWKNHVLVQSWQLWMKTLNSLEALLIYLRINCWDLEKTSWRWSKTLLLKIKIILMMRL